MLTARPPASRSRSRLVPGQGGKSAGEMVDAMDVLFLLVPTKSISRKKAGFTVYIGRTATRRACGGCHSSRRDLHEKSGTWVNTEGRVQMGNRAAFAPGEAREDWAIIRALFRSARRKLPFDLARRIARETLCGPSAFRRSRRDARRPQRRNCRTCTKSRCDGEIRVCVSGQRLLFDEPDSARIRRHGRMLGPGAQQFQSCRGMSARE